ncbi:MAG: VanZ family protein [Gammaproteobacteria bacterium]
MALNRTPLRYFSLWLGIGWLLIATVLFASLAPSGVPTITPHSDKVGHFLAYFSLTLWFAQLYRTRPRMAWAIGFVVMGALLECLQALTSHRVFSLADMAANTAGVLAGWALSSLAGINFLLWFELWLEKSRA